MECVDDMVNQDVTEQLADELNCGLHMSCTSSFANFGPYNDQPDQGM